jgi:hypothetical protein
MDPATVAAIENLVARLVGEIIRAIVRLLTGPIRHELVDVVNAALARGSVTWWGGVWGGAMTGVLAFVVLLLLVDFWARRRSS